MNGLRLDVPFAKSWIVEAYGIYTSSSSRRLTAVTGRLARNLDTTSLGTLKAASRPGLFESRPLHRNRKSIQPISFRQCSNRFSLAFLNDGPGASFAERFKGASKNGPSALFRRAISIGWQGSVQGGKSAVRGAHSPGRYLLGFPAMADPALKPASASTLFTAASLKALMVSLLLYWCLRASTSGHHVGLSGL